MKRKSNNNQNESESEVDSKLEQHIKLNSEDVNIGKQKLEDVLDRVSEDSDSCSKSEEIQMDLEVLTQTLNRNRENIVKFSEKLGEEIFRNLGVQKIKVDLKIQIDYIPEFHTFMKIYDQDIQKMLSNKALKRNWNDDDIMILVWMLIYYEQYYQVNYKDFSDTDWEFVSSCIPGQRSDKCKFKILQLQKTKTQTVPWTNEENQLLSDLVGQNGKKAWSSISQTLYEISGSQFYRSGKQCREHYNNFLDPNVRRGPWTKQQDLELFRLVKEKGKQWSQISRCLNGRTDNSVKNRYYVLFRKEIESNDFYCVKLDEKDPNDIKIHSNPESIILNKLITRIQNQFNENCSQVSPIDAQQGSSPSIYFNKIEKQSAPSKEEQFFISLKGQNSLMNNMINIEKSNNQQDRDMATSIGGELPKFSNEVSNQNYSNFRRNIDCLQQLLFQTEERADSETIEGYTILRNIPNWSELDKPFTLQCCVNFRTKEIFMPQGNTQSEDFKFQFLDPFQQSHENSTHQVKLEIEENQSNSGNNINNNNFINTNNGSNKFYSSPEIWKPVRSNPMPMQNQNPPTNSFGYFNQFNQPTAGVNCNNLNFMSMGNLNNNLRPENNLPYFYPNQQQQQQQQQQQSQQQQIPVPVYFNNNNLNNSLSNFNGINPGFVNNNNNGIPNQFANPNVPPSFNPFMQYNRPNTDLFEQNNPFYLQLQQQANLAVAAVNISDEKSREINCSMGSETLSEMNQNQMSLNLKHSQQSPVISNSDADLNSDQPSQISRTGFRVASINTQRQNIVTKSDSPAPICEQGKSSTTTTGSSTYMFTGKRTLPLMKEISNPSKINHIMNSFN